MPGKKFPDLTGDGKVTRKDILKGRGVEGFKKGGKVSKTEKTAAMEDAYKDQKVKYARVPMEPVSGEEPSAFEDAMRYERRRAGEAKTFSDGGMVRGCKGVQVSGKGFKGTF
jgi:hypothetical protein